MARARHIGKVVITQTGDGVESAVARPAAPLIDADASYLVTGGLGALGLHVAKWLVDRGARNLLLAGRRDPSTAARAIIDSLERRARASIRGAATSLGTQKFAVCSTPSPSNRCRRCAASCTPRVFSMTIPCSS